MVTVNELTHLSMKFSWDGDISILGNSLFFFSVCGSEQLDTNKMNKKHSINVNKSVICAGVIIQVIQVFFRSPALSPADRAPCCPALPPLPARLSSPPARLRPTWIQVCGSPIQTLQETAKELTPSGRHLGSD